MKISKNKLIMIKDKDYETDSIKSCHDVYDFLKDKIELNKEPEEVVVMFALDNKKNIINFSELSRGTINNSLLYPSILTTIAQLSAKVILFAGLKVLSSL